MDLKRTKHNTLRGTRADVVTSEMFLLIKRVSELRATYQIRLLTYAAIRDNKKLVIEVPGECVIHRGLHDLAQQYSGNVTIVRE